MPEIRLPEGTKCKWCGREIKDATVQGTKFTCERCGETFNPLHEKCAQRPCPKCGGRLLDEWEITKKRFGKDVLF